MEIPVITVPNVRNCLEKRYDFDLSTIHFVFNFSNDDLNNSAIPLPIGLEGKSTLFSAKSHTLTIFPARFAGSQI